MVELPEQLLEAKVEPVAIALSARLQLQQVVAVVVVDFPLLMPVSQVVQVVVAQVATLPVQVVVVVVLVA